MSRHRNVHHIIVMYVTSRAHHNKPSATKGTSQHHNRPLRSFCLRSFRVAKASRSLNLLSNQSSMALALGDHCLTFQLVASDLISLQN